MRQPFSLLPDFASLPMDRFGFGGAKPLERHGNVRARLHNLLPQSYPVNPDQSSVWATFDAEARKVLTALSLGSVECQADIINGLFGSPLTHGFAQGHVVYRGLQEREEVRRYVASIILARLYRLCEVVGAVRVLSPEHNQNTIEVGDLDVLLDRLSNCLDFDVRPPRQDGALFGLEAAGGVLTERHFDGMYAAWRIRNLTRDLGHDAPRICEIGGGAGYVAYYAKMTGISDYTIIDLPAARAVQFLVLAGEGDDQHISLGEVARWSFSLMLDTAAEQIDFAQFNMVVNIDSLPEMPSNIARRYVKMAANAGCFLSINQESAMMNGNERQNVVADLCAHTMRRRYRRPSWLRLGYVEEFFQPIVRPAHIL